MHSEPGNSSLRGRLMLARGTTFALAFRLPCRTFAENTSAVGRDNVKDGTHQRNPLVFLLFVMTLKPRVERYEGL